MSKKVKFTTLSILLLIGRFYDVYTTSLYTPDLQNELNPLVKFMGAGWTTMITLQLALSILVIGCLYYYMFHFNPTLPKERGLSRKEVISFMMYNDTNSLGKIWYSIPHNRGVLISSTGYTATFILIIISYLVGTSTTLLIILQAYKDYYIMGIPYVFYTIIIFTAIWFYYRFFNNYYQKYLHLTGSFKSK